ncbi:hypothetical protein AALO_G00094540 [Alosa alosa]|uniref:C2H2-type domain-containing protein n=1 Tax=Alosa alosa TaxID=278164 RepID=A0AAV6GW40_9TELE|nr:zinc finger protein-like [Alosa alosa]KAG5278041.1 hypothetical protein AALO_G00094540 [Alosa alosa]
MAPVLSSQLDLYPTDPVPLVHLDWSPTEPHPLVQLGMSSTDPEPLVQLRRVSVVLVDCCRTQGQLGKDKYSKTGVGHQCTAEKLIKCETCDERFNQVASLNKHTGERPFHCPECDKSLPQKKHIKRHQCVRTGGRLYDCPHCDKRQCYFRYTRERRNISNFLKTPAYTYRREAIHMHPMWKGFLVRETFRYTTVHTERM